MQVEQQPERQEQTVLVVGDAGREHALAWKIAQSPGVKTVFVAPGNGGTGGEGWNVDIDADNIDGLVAFASDHKVDLTVVGPEKPLTEGIVDAFREEGLTIFGPTQAAAELEGNKAKAYRFTRDHHIPHPKSHVFTNIEAALAYLDTVDPTTIVIKAAGLAAGKGVVLPDSLQEGQATFRAMMLDGRFGKEGETTVVQERLSGPEISVLAITDGRTIRPMLPAQDHKRAFDHDEGPNTGGMGAYAPVFWLDADMMPTIQDTILQPTIDGMREEGVLYQGVLYAGLMLTDDGPKVLEFNTRFGDPETQPMMMLLESDLPPLLHATINGTLAETPMTFYDGHAVCVVLAAAGYPGSYARNQEIAISDHNDPNVVVFHAGTTRHNGRLATNGGRVLGVTAYGRTHDAAVAHAYDFIEQKRGTRFESMHYRKDIGRRKGGNE